MFKKGLLALTLVFSLPVFAAEHWIDVRVPEQYQQEHVQGAINIPLKEVKERIATAVPDKNDTVKVYCNAGRQSGQAKEILSEGNDSNLLIVFYVQIMPDDFVMQLHRF
ncbi:thiosulfate sulfurtransferase PspE [Escherichia coli]|uniref:thiosulfate sulfurtransferase PspE n=1 Tax=Escherichia coli TaxID=562 RepID=UPI000989D0C9